MNVEVGVSDLEPGMLIVLLPVLVLLCGLVLWSLIDIARRDRVGHLPKGVWVLLVLLAIPIGSIMYLVLGRTPAPTPVPPPHRTVEPPAAPAMHSPAPRKLAADGPNLALQVDDLSVTFTGGAGIHDVNFAARDRSVTAVIGPNGAGKTVLFCILAGLLRADAGSVQTHPGARVAYCPDVPQFEGWLTAREVVETSLSVSGMRGGTDPDTALLRCGLSDVADRRVADFSRGMLQRLGIAAALVLDPDVLILDEPNSALDPIGRADIRRLILEQKQQRCILLSSHMLSEVEQLADEVIVLSRGRIVAAGDTTALLTQGLEPAWTIRLAGPAGTPLGDLRADFPGVALDFPAQNLCTAVFASFDDAATALPRVLAGLHAPVVEVTLRDRDLDGAFARIVERTTS